MAANQTESYVQVAADGSGKKIDNFTVTLDDGTTTVYRQVTVTGDPQYVGNIQRVNNGGEATVDAPRIEEVLRDILTELKVHTFILNEAFNRSANLTLLREQINDF